MAKLIPGKIRTEGIALYEAGKIEILKVKDQMIYSRVENHNLRYSLDDEAIFCACDFFQKKKSGIAEINRMQRYISMITD